MTTARFRTLAAAIVLLAAVLRFWALDLGLPNVLARPDDIDIVLQTGKVARGQLDLEWGVYPSAYVYLCWAWGAAGLRAAERLGFFPPASYLMVLEQHPERLVLIDRALSATFSTATVGLLMAVTRTALGPAPGLAAGALLATSFLHARDAHSVKPDAAVAFFVVLALAALARMAERATIRRAVVAGVCVGLAMSAKQPAALLLAPAWLAAVLGSPYRGWRRFVSVPALVVAATAGGVFVATSPFLILNPTTRGFTFLVLANVLPSLFGGAPRGSATLPATIALPPWWNAFAYHATFSLRYGSGLLATLAALPAVVWGFVTKYPLPRVSAAFAVVYFAVVGTSPVLLARYMDPLLPVLALLLAGATWAAARRVAGRHAWAVLSVATLLLGMEPLTAAVAHDRIAARPDTRVLASRWMAEHLPPGSRIGAVGALFWPWGEPQFPPTVTKVRLPSKAEDIRAAGVRFLLVHDHVLFSSQVDEHELRALEPDLELLVEFDPRVPGAEPGIFEAADAYYIPIGRLGAVDRAGPRVRIYALRGAGLNQATHAPPP